MLVFIFLVFLALIGLLRHALLTGDFEKMWTVVGLAVVVCVAVIFLASTDDGGYL